jgi:hypothetical protein
VATHFSELNDLSEVKLLQEPLAAVLANRCRELILNRQRESFDMRRRIAKAGGVHKVAEGLARDFVASMYKVTFDGGGTVNFGSPFIASFCSHVADQSYERQHGLLSQWRGYGHDGGYCIVFDTAKLVELIEMEFVSFDYVHMNIGPARYSHEGKDISTVFPELVDFSEKLVAETLKGNLNPSSEDGLGAFLAGATLFKHRAFYEEREVRIVAMPSPKELQARVLKEDKNLVPRSIKPIETRDGDRGKRHYISLFDGLDVQLPIKRVIVGPSRHQQKNVARVRELLRNDVDVSASVTPFVD